MIDQQRRLDMTLLSHDWNIHSNMPEIRSTKYWLAQKVFIFYILLFKA